VSPYPALRRLVRARARSTRFPGSAPGARSSRLRSPWSIPFPRRTPRRLPHGLGQCLCSLLARPFVGECHKISTLPTLRPCSPASQVLRDRPTPRRRARRAYGVSPFPTVPHRHPAGESPGSPGSRAWSFHACLGSATPRRRTTACVSRRRSCCLPPVRTRSARRRFDFGAEYPACVYPCRCHTRSVTTASVRLGAGMVR
jgi:hypothetical protein